MTAACQHSYWPSIGQVVAGRTEHYVTINTCSRLAILAGDGKSGVWTRAVRTVAGRPGETNPVGPDVTTDLMTDCRGRGLER